MFSFIWHTFFFDPIYNALVFFVAIVPHGDVGLAIVFTTIVVRLILLPLSLKASRTQRAMRELEPLLKEIQEKYKNSREELGKKLLEAYSNAGVNPFSSILLLFIQIPIIIALYLSVWSGGGIALPAINTDLLYGFVPVPDVVSMLFLGLLDIAAKSLPLALLAGATQYLHTAFLLPKQEPRKKDAEPNFKEDFARSMQLQMRYVLPIVIVIVAYTTSAAIALYFTVSNIISIIQELFIKRTHKTAAK
jgi:YidC/Oxa1 family membrane protein insertase